MMFSDSFFREFDNDPFFSMHRDRMHQMDNIFGMFGRGDPLMSITDGGGADRQQRGYRAGDRYSRDVKPAGRRSRVGDVMPSNGRGAVGVWDPFAHMNQMMSSMQSMMGNISRQMEEVQNDPDSHSYVQSSVMSYSKVGDGEPKVFQATSATRQAPGKVKETRKAVRDSEAGVEKMSIGRHLNDRGQVITRQRNTRTGDIDENRDYINLDEAEAHQFDEDWQNVTSRYAQRRDRNAVGHQPHGRQSQSRAVDDRHTRPHESTSKHKAIGHRAEKAY